MARRLYKNAFTVFFTFTTLLLLTACGKNDSPTSTTDQEREEEIKFRQLGDVYRAVLTPLNTNLSGSPSGIVEVKILEGKITVESAMTSTPEGVKHFQIIHERGNCPDQSHDSNQDGLIDIEEAQTQTGKMLIPLDDDLNRQDLGINYAPNANEWGNYVYKRSAPLKKLLSDLHSSEVPRHEYLAKLSPDEELNLKSRTVVIYGVAPSEATQAQVTFNGNTPEESLPIACGKFVKFKYE